jgi:hypothetical protein
MNALKKSFVNVTQGSFFDEEHNLGIYFLGIFLGC